MMSARAQRPGPSARAAGFTLVEIAIALALLAIALAAVSRATQTSAEAGRELRSRTLAQWVAQNRVAERLAERRWLAPGEYRGAETQAGVVFVWRERVSDTANVTLRRLDVSVAAATEPQRALATMTGFIPLERDR